MIAREIYPEWRSSNTDNNYPFAEHVTLVNDDGRMLLPGFLLDAVLYPIGGKVGLYLSQVVLTHDSVTIYVGTLAEPLLCSGSFDVVSPPDSVKLVDAAGRPAGLLVSESVRFAILQSLGVGTHEFAPEQTEFCASCCVPTPEVGVRGIQLPDGEVLVGDIWLVGDDGVVVRTEELSEPAGCRVTAETLSAIRIDIVGDPLYRRRLCSGGALFSTPRFIETLRIVGPNQTFDCAPDQYGEFKISILNASAQDTVLRFSPTANGISVGAVGQKLKE